MRARRFQGPVRSAALTLGAATLAAGCSWFSPTKTALREVAVIAESGANGGSGTVVDLVFVHDAATAAALPRTSPDWFLHSQTLKTALGPKIETVSVQLPAGESIEPAPLPAHYKDALVVYCYVNFAAPAGQGVADLTPYKRVRITLSRNAVTYDGAR
jgi:hypothetical protein